MYGSTSRKQGSQQKSMRMRTEDRIHTDEGDAREGWSGEQLGWSTRITDEDSVVVGAV